MGGVRKPDIEAIDLMSAIDGSQRDHATPDDALPRFELSYLFDDRDKPTEVTVFPESNEYDISTNWITIDVSSAVPLDNLR